MQTPRPTTIAAYIMAASPAGKAHLQRLFEVLSDVAPHADAIMKWNTPFFVEPRFLFSFSAHKLHLGFTPSAAGLDPFRSELSGYEITKAGILKVRYVDPLPEKLIRRIAKQRIEAVAARTDSSFW